MSRKAAVLSSFLVMGILFLGLTLGMNCSTKKKEPLPPPHSATFGGAGADVGNSVQQTSDGGYIIAGFTESYGAGGAAVWLIKTDSSLNEVWDRVFGGSGGDVGYSVQQTTDGGYIIAGTTRSYGAGGDDVWLIKTDASGSKTWDKIFGGTGDDDGFSVQQTTDGGYIVVGSTTSYGAGGYDVWLIKTDASGNEVWDKTFGGRNEDVGYSVQQTSDGGYIVAGYTQPDTEPEYSHVWLIKTDAYGNKVWDKTFGGSEDDEAYSVQQASDGGYVLTGVSLFRDLPVFYAWLVETDSLGNEVWDWPFSGIGNGRGSSVKRTSDGGYIMTGWTESSGAGERDVWLIKTDANGHETWDKTFGGTGDDQGNSVQQTSDGGYVITGSTTSYGAGSDDVWLIKTDADGN